MRRRNGLKLCKKVRVIYSAECIEMLSGRGQKDEDGFISENFGSGQLLRCLIVLSFAVTVNSSSEIGLMRHTVKKPRVWAVLTAQENIWSFYLDRPVWPDVKIICSVLRHLQMWKFAQWHIFCQSRFNILLKWWNFAQLVVDVIKVFWGNSKLRNS